MNSVSFEGIGEMVATFPAETGVAGGKLVKLGTDGKVAPCGAGERFCGIALEPEEGFAAVQVSGFATVLCKDGGVAPGWTALVGDGQGGAKKAATEASGGVYLVVAADSATGTAVVRL